MYPEVETVDCVRECLCKLLDSLVMRESFLFVGTVS